MTLAELRIIEQVLIEIANKDPKYKCALNIVLREIKLKTIDPRK